jgi:2-polyprenyl-3-methyl-5-hydroxy-6-metoxy-1,4-benzoquinol methylase
MKRQLVFMPRLKNIQAYCSTGRLLDIGCSNGAFIEAATACGWEACGIELRKSSASFARERGLDVFMQPLNELHFQDNSFDAITMWQVLEHLPDPPECMNECCRILKPGGIFAFSTPNVQSIGWRVLKSDWPAIDPGCHHHLFKPATVTMMLEKCGFEKCLLRTEDLLPATIKTVQRKLRNKKMKKPSNAMASLVQQSSPKKLSRLLKIRRMLNIPLNITGLGEDIYGYFRKAAWTN